MIVFYYRLELEEERQVLIVQSVVNKKVFKEIEDKIFHIFFVFEGNILEDELVIKVFDFFKIFFDEIFKK